MMTVFLLASSLAGLALAGLALLWLACLRAERRARKSGE